MKIQIDTTNTTISVEEDITFSDLEKQLNKLFPKKEWKKFKLKTNVVINWTNPITIPQRYPIYDKYPYRPSPVWYEVGKPYCGTAVYTDNNTFAVKENASYGTSVNGMNVTYKEIDPELLTLTGNGVYCVETGNN